MRGGLGKQDWVLGALYRLAVRGVDEQKIIELMRLKLCFSEEKSVQLVGHWFSKQYRHGLHYQIAEYKNRFSPHEN